MMNTVVTAVDSVGASDGVGTADCDDKYTHVRTWVSMDWRKNSTKTTIRVRKFYEITMTWNWRKKKQSERKRDVCSKQWRENETDEDVKGKR